MARRIRYGKCHAGLIDELVKSKGSTGPFDTKARCLVYAAGYAASFGPEKGRKKLPESTAEALRYSTFTDLEYFDEFLLSLAILVKQDIKILEDKVGDDSAVNSRIEIFEEFANYGLERLGESLKSEHDKTDGINLLLLGASDTTAENSAIDWSALENL